MVVSGLPAPRRDRDPEAGGEDEATIACRAADRGHTVSRS